MSEAPRRLADDEARRIIREDFQTTLFVEAAAGTGKTTALVGRVLGLLESGLTTLDRVVAVTFTEKAAGEMKLRLRGEIELARSHADTLPEERERLDRALGHLELARINTIHAFCSDLLHERPIEAGVDPMFQVAAEDEASRLLAQAFDAWFLRVLADPPEGVRRVLRQRPRGLRASGPRDRLFEATRQLLQHRDHRTPWRRPPFDRDRAIDETLHALADAAELAERARDPSDWLAQNLAHVKRFLDETALRESVRERDHDGLEVSLRNLARDRRAGWHWRGRWEFGEGLSRDDVLDRRDRAKATLDDLVERCDADLAPLLFAELMPVVDDYESLKLRAGRLDFVDLLLKTRELLRENLQVRRELGERYSHYFVDEFQDTDPLQSEILTLLASDDGTTDWMEARCRQGKLFFVGDPKQSIYRFRGADVAVYEAVKRRLSAQGARVLHLTTSFRSLPGVQDAVNAAFSKAMVGNADGTQASYVPLGPHREAVTERPSLVVLPVPKPYADYGKVTHWKIEESFPDAVGAFVAWMVESSGWTVEERGALVPLRPRHVCLLFRRFRSWSDDVTRPYVRALEARRVAHVLVGGHSFHDREEVLAVRNALVAIEWPDDALRVFATLRGPLFALGDDALLAYRHRVGTLHPLQPVERKDLPQDLLEVADALAILRRLHATRNRRPLAWTLGHLLDTVRAHAGIAIWPTGEQALANLLRTLDLARRFERGGASSFRAFVEWMEAQALRGEGQDAPVVEEGTEGVRIMTVHRAKGLEFPVVILCDPTCKATREHPTRFVDPARGVWVETLCGCAPRELLDEAPTELERDREEAVRVAYVAATRARDLLVVPGLGDGSFEPGGWLESLEPAVSPKTAGRAHPASAPGCPAFGAETVAERPARVGFIPGGPVRPGLHRPAEGEHAVVWWDPNTLQLGVEPMVGLRQQRILEADADHLAADQSQRTHEAWQTRLKTARTTGSVPSLDLHTVTGLAQEPSTLEALQIPSYPVDVVAVALERSGRPKGRRFGILVHAVLATVPLDADREQQALVARQQGRLLGASESEIAFAIDSVDATLHHPLLNRAANAQRLRREVPVFLPLDAQGLAEGKVDLAFEEATGWTVVDFKTDGEIEERRDVYVRQVQWYAHAMAKATGRPVVGVLLQV